MNSSKRSSLFTTRPGIWLVLSIITGGMIATVQWHHPQALVIAGGLGSVSVLFLVLAAFYAGRGSSTGIDHSFVTKGLDASNDGYLLTGKDGEFLYTSPNFHRLLAFAGSEEVSRQVLSFDSIIDALNGEASEQVSRLRSGLLDGVSGYTEFAIRGSDANYEWRRLSVAPIQQKAEATSGALWRVEDVTSMRELEGIRRAEEERVTDMLDLLPVGFSRQIKRVCCSM